MARALNKVMGRKGPVFADRYHAHLLASPRQAANAVRYVLENWKVHAAREGQPAPLRRRPILLCGLSGLRAAAGCGAALVDAAYRRREVQRARASGVSSATARASLASFRVRILLISSPSGPGAAGRTTSGVLRGPRTRSRGRPSNPRRSRWSSVRTRSVHRRRAPARSAPRRRPRTPSGLGVDPARRARGAPIWGLLLPFRLAHHDEAFAVDESECPMRPPSPSTLRRTLKPNARQSQSIAFAASR